MVYIHLFDIQEICDLVAFFLPLSDCLALARVSRQFHVAFLPAIWRTAHIRRVQSIAPFELALPKYGLFIRHLRIDSWSGHTQLPMQVRLYCPNLTSMAILDRATALENRMFVSNEASSLHALELYLSCKECTLLLSACHEAFSALRNPWASLQSLEITFAPEMYQAIYSFSISDFLEAFPACQKLVLRHAPFRGIDQKSNIVTNTTGSPVAPKHLLRELRLPPTSEMDIPSMVKVLESQNQLRSIEFGGHRHQQRIEDIFEALPVFCPHLTSFVMLIATSSMPNALWINLFNSYPNLWRFHVGGSIMDDSVVRLLPQCCKGLKDLSISHCPNVTFQSVRDILTSCSRLVCLNVGGVELSSEVFTGSVEWACKATLRDLSLRCLQARRADHEQIRYRLEQLVELERLTMCGRHMHMDMMLPPLENMLKDLQGEDQQDVKQEQQEQQEQEQQEQQEQEQQEQQEQEQEQYPYLHECLAPPQPLYPRLKMLRFQEFETLMNVEQTQRFFAEVPEIEAAYMTRCFDSNAITWLSQYRRDLGFGSVRRF